MSNETTVPTKDILFQNDGLMKKVHEHLDHKLHRISTGRAHPAVLDDIRVDSYGTRSPLNQVATVNTPDSRTITIQPWDKSLLAEIEKAIQAANLGFNPSSNGLMVIINVPVPTEERRKELVKSVHKEAENARVSLRNLRHQGMASIKAAKMTEDTTKDAEKQLDVLTANWNKKVDLLVQAKEADIMKV